jgi:hypothetical protein
MLPLVEVFMLRNILVAKLCAAFLTLAVSSTACVTSADREVSLNSDPREDRAYRKVVQRAMQSADVIKNFETRVKIQATYLSPEFRAAFTKRLAEVFQQTQPSFEEAEAKAGFFVSIFSPIEGTIDLANPYHWNIFMKTKDGQLKPAIIKKVNDKVRWGPFFEQINPWTTEYLIVFDTAPVNPNAPELVEKIPVELVMANADAQVTLSW